jgi:hypothetical protein
MWILTGSRANSTQCAPSGLGRRKQRGAPGAGRWASLQFTLTKFERIQ